MSVEHVEATIEAAWANVLSKRELEVALLAASGLSNKEVARQTGAAEPTVKQHMNRVLRKLGAPNRYNLILIARRGGRG
jgi:two-component system nitrate/nitrite response regulator NarL